MIGIVRTQKLAEREGFAAREYADCTLCCWEGRSTLCYTARGWQRKSYIRHSAEAARSTIWLCSDKPDKQNESSSLSAILSWAIAAYINP